MTGIVLRSRDDGIAVRIMEPTTRPMGIAGSPPMVVDSGDHTGGTGEVEGSMEDPAFILQEVDLFLHLLLPHRTFLRIFGEGGNHNSCYVDLQGKA